MIIGYARVSTKNQAKDGNSLEAQENILREKGAEIIYKEVFTGTKTDRPVLTKLLEEIQPNDTLMVTKLDRMARTTVQGINLIQELIGKGVTVNILNMGVIDNSTTGKLITSILLAISEFERNTIIDRTIEGKQIARQRADFVEGRPKKFSKEQIDLALELYKQYPASQVVKMTGISRSTLLRAKRERCNVKVI